MIQNPPKIVPVKILPTRNRGAAPDEAEANMKIVYHCYGGAHASPTAAAIHLGLFPSNRWPRYSDFKKIEHFDRMTWNDHGRLVKAGVDASGNEVYILGRRNSPKLIIGLIREFIRLTGGDPDEYYFVNCVQRLNLFMVTGGFSSRSLGLVHFGRPIVTFGTLLSYPILAAIVRRTMEEIRKPCIGVS
jgi:hypothetical protein